VGRGAASCAEVRPEQDLPPFFMLTGGNIGGQHQSDRNAAGLGCLSEQIDDVRWVYKTLVPARELSLRARSSSSAEARTRAPIVAEYHSRSWHGSKRGLCPAARRSARGTATE